MTPEELEDKLRGLQWKESPAELDRKVRRSMPGGSFNGALKLAAAALAASIVIGVVGFLFFGGDESKPVHRPKFLAKKNNEVEKPVVQPPEPTQKAPAPIPAAEEQPLPEKVDGWAIVTDAFGWEGVGRTLEAPVTLEIGENEMASLRLEDGSTLKLNGGTHLEVDASGWKWSLQAGEIFCMANPEARRPDIEIETPTGTARITGTEFNLTASSARTLLAVRKGSVDLSNPHGRVQVGAHHQAQATADAAPQKKRLVNESRVFGWARQLKGVRRHPVEKSFLSDEEADGAAGTLTADGAPLTLVKHIVRVHIEDDIARTEIEQIFRNNTNRRLEGTFRFPLPKQASIARFAMSVTDDRIMEGRIVEKQRARRIYESIIRRKEDPGLLEWQEGNQFTARIFPIEPQGTKKTIIAYTQTLQRRDGTVRYVMPLVSEALVENPAERFLFEVRVRCGDRIVRFESPSHQLDIARGTDRDYHASAEALDYTPLNDFVLEYAVEMQPKVTALRHGEVFLLRVPQVFEARRHVAVGTAIFWLDVSHSTTASLQEIQYNLLDRLLAKLEPGDRFNVLTNDLAGEFLFESPVPASEENRERALARIWSVNAGGGTDLSAGLRKLREGVPADATLVYIGDGVATLGVRDHAELERLFSELKAKRFFAFALGNSVDELLLERLATHRAGAVFHLTPGENLARQADAFAWVVTRPMMTEIQVEVEGATEVFPKKFGGLFEGQELLLLGRTLNDMLRVRVTGRIEPDRVTFERGIDLSQTPKNPFLRRLWAQRKVADLLSGDNPAKYKERIISLSKQYTIMTPYTSLLVLETEKEFEKYRIEKEEKAGEKKFTRKDLDGLIEEMKKGKLSWEEAQEIMKVTSPESREMLRDLTDSFELHERYGDSFNKPQFKEPAKPEAKPEPARTPTPKPVPAQPAPNPVPRGVFKRPAPPPAETREPEMPVPARTEPPPMPPPETIETGRRAKSRRRPRQKVEEPEEEIRPAPGLRPSPNPPVEPVPAGGQPVRPIYGTGRELEKQIGLDIQEVETAQQPRAQRAALARLEGALSESNLGRIKSAIAIEGLQTLLRFEPGYRKGWIHLSRVFEDLGDRTQAMRALTTVTEVAPHDPEAHQLMGDVLQKRGYLDLAAYAFRTVTLLRPEEPESYFRLAHLLLAQEDHAGAEKVYIRLLRYNFEERFGGVEARARAGLEKIYRETGETKKLNKLRRNALVFRDIRVMLMWDTPDTDIDLWVSAPGEEKCSYKQMSTFRGGRLDHDDTDGYGPENYTLPDFRPGAWKIQVNYYAGKGRTTGSVQIILFEGTERERIVTKPFVLNRKKETVTLFDGRLETLTR